MPITNDVSITPSVNLGGGGAMVPEGVYSVIVSDITYIPGEQNQFGGKPQLKFRFKITEGDQKDLELVSWVSLTLNAGWDKGSPSNLFKMATAVMGEEPDMEREFYPNVLIGGLLQVVVESRKSKTGKEFSRITNYLKATRSTAKVSSKAEVVDDYDGPEDEEEEELQPKEINKNKIPF
jgi:hypothetical protein